MFYVLIQIWVFGLFCLVLYFFKVYEHNSRLKINERGQIKTTAEIEMDELVREYN